MDKTLIFSDSIIFSKIEDLKLTEIILNVLSENEKNNKGVIKSNIGGFQTEPVDNFYINESFIEEAAKCLQNNYRMKKQSKLNLLDLWINKNYKGSINIPHIHPKSNFSGVFYVSVPEKEGKLMFLRNDKTAAFTDNSMYIEGSDFHNIYEIQPLNNMFILFPSHLNHMVAPHSNDNPRISVSFNLKLCDE